MKTILQSAAAGTTVPMWNFSVTSPIDNKNYSGEMIGRDPGFNAHGHTTTAIDFYLVPLILVFPNNGPTFDPTTPNSCNLDNTMNPQSALFLAENSPEFVSTPITINGVVSEGMVQYTDAFQRAEFNGVPPGTNLSTLPYHLKYNLIVAAAQTINVPSTWSPVVSTENCGTEGTIDVDMLDSYLQNTAIPAVQGAGTNSVVMFLLDSVYETRNGEPYCAGYHSAYFPNGGSLPQIYGFVRWDSGSGTVPTGKDCATHCADIQVLSHEIAELTNDPLWTVAETSNPAPAWGNVGQVRGCQADLEVADPLSGTLFYGITLGDFTYHPQELAFFDWFYRIHPSRGAAGVYSDNGSFATYQHTVCGSS